MIDRLISDFPQLARSISYTTRFPRSSENEGVHYHFVDNEAFQQKIDSGFFLEHETVHGALYGTPRVPLEERRAAGLDTVLDIDTKGAFRFKAYYPEAVLVFIMPPSLDDLEARLRARGTDSESSIRRRIEDARSQMAESSQFDHVIINSDLETAYQQLKSLLISP